MTKTRCKKKVKPKMQNDQVYRCEKCDMAANKKKDLCKPVKI